MCFKKCSKGFLSAAPALFSVSFIASLYQHNMAELALSALLIPLSAAVFFAIMVLFIAGFLFKEKSKRNVFACFLIILFFSYGQAAYLLGQFKKIAIGKDIVVFPIWLAIMIILFLLIKKTKKELLTFNKFLMAVSLISIILPAAQIGKFEFSQRILHPKAQSPLALPETTKIDPDSMPDIYFIVPDSYASSDVLKKNFKYDNSGLRSYLEKTGFFVPRLATSNYPKTFLSLASTLNMEYLDYLSDRKNSSDINVVAPLINDNNVKRFLSGFGYKYYQLGSWWGITNNNPHADSNFTLEGTTLGSLDLFNYSILQSTMIKPFVSQLIPKKFIGNSDEDGRNRTLFQFEKLPEAAKLPGPKFVFAHIIAPHIPYVFGKSCEFPHGAHIAMRSEEENYANQVTCIDKKLEEAVGKIIENSDKPPVILLQSDEGVPFLRDRLPSTDEWGKADDRLLQEKFPIFSAYYLPGKATSTLYDSISSVNSFRAILNLYFGTNLPILPDKNYIFPDLNHLYEFEEVTERLK